MRDEAKSSSFEPRKLREAVKMLVQIEASLNRRDFRKYPPPNAPEKEPGLLLRWWRLLFES